MTTLPRSLRFSFDFALGATGGGLALAAVSFGLYMNVHGPVSSFGTSQDFTVFAQLAAHRPGSGGRAIPPKPGDDLDTSATASISKAGAPVSEIAEPNGKGVIASMVLESAGDDFATVAVGGKRLLVRVGDEVPGAGAVLEIVQGDHPSLRTARGLIVARAE